MIPVCKRAFAVPSQRAHALLARPISRTSAPVLRLVRWRSSAPAKSAASAATPTSPGVKQYIFPKRLLLYHAGTGRTVFIGCTKISTLFLFGFFCTIVAPSYYYNPSEDNWMVPAIIAAGAIPMLYVGLTTKPFTTYVHILLPEAARVSREALTKWLNKSGRDMTLDFTTMRFLGVSRTTRVPMAELKRRKEGSADISNLMRETTGSSRRSYVRSLFGVPKRFHVGMKTNYSKEPKLWKALLERIPQDTSKAPKSSAK